MFGAFSAAAQMPAKPAIFASLEGGAACPFGDQIDALGTMHNVAAAFGAAQGTGSMAFGNGGCGWTGRAGVGLENAPLFGEWLNYWGAYVRHSRMGRDNFEGTYTTTTPGPGTYFASLPGRYDEKRTVVDLEAGQDFKTSANSAKTRIFLGVRYERFDGHVTAEGSSRVTVLGVTVTTPWSCGMKLRTDAVGPRAGIGTQIPLGGGLGLSFGAAASALYGDRDTHCHISVAGFADMPVNQSKSGWVGNLEGEAALNYRLPGSGAELAVGVRAEAWYNQVESGIWHAGADRNEWGPFARLKMSFGD